MPLAGLLVLLPPVVEVTGVEFLVVMRFDENTLSALICSSRPLHPSHSLVYHRTPQVLLLFPVQASAAASAELWSLGRIFDDVDGTRTEVKASQADVRPLKRISLLLQTSLGSQRISDMAWSYFAGKKVSKVTFRRPLTAFCHLVLDVPLV